MNLNTLTPIEALALVPRLVDRIEELEGILGVQLDIAPPRWLTPREFKLLALIMTAAPRVVNRDHAMAAIYGDCAIDERPEIKILDVFICKIRRKLKTRGLVEPDVIGNSWGRGWCVTPENAARIRALMAGEQ